MKPDTPRTHFALSVKQPWAALIVHGVKTIEIRSWLTQRRGPILIHASRQVDERSTGWERLPDEAEETVQLLGGIIGAVELVECHTYASRTDFAADVALHLNQPAWFREPRLYGFEFAHPKVLPFRQLPGWVKFFKVELDEE